MVTDPFQVALQVAEVLERCGLRYLVGGSPFDTEQMARRLFIKVASQPDRFSISTRRKTSCCRSCAGFAAATRCRTDNGAMFLASSPSKETVWTRRIYNEERACSGCPIFSNTP